MVSDLRQEQALGALNSLLEGMRWLATADSNLHETDNTTF